jgi:hypothetical protein
MQFSDTELKAAKRMAACKAKCFILAENVAMTPLAYAQNIVLKADVLDLQGLAESEQRFLAGDKSTVVSHVVIQDGTQYTVFACENESITTPLTFVQKGSK